MVKIQKVTPAGDGRVICGEMLTSPRLGLSLPVAYVHPDTGRPRMLITSEIRQVEIVSGTETIIDTLNSKYRIEYLDTDPPAG